MLVKQEFGMLQKLEVLTFAVGADVGFRAVAGPVEADGVARALLVVGASHGSSARPRDGKKVESIR